MKREQEYRHLADDVFKRGAEELNAQLKAQWEILVADIWNSQISRKQLTRTKRSMIRSHGTGSGKTVTTREHVTGRSAPIICLQAWSRLLPSRPIQ
jgi:hypothetical protein